MACVITTDKHKKWAEGKDVSAGFIAKLDQEYLTISKGIEAKSFNELMSINKIKNEYLRAVKSNNLAKQINARKSTNRRANEKITEPKNIDEYIDYLQKRFNCPVSKIDSINDIPIGEKPRLLIERDIKNGTKITKGWYNASTGEVVIYMPNITSINDIGRTLLHELKGHKGLRALFGEKNVGQAMSDIHKNLPKNIQKQINNSAKKYYNNNIQRATEEYLSTLAEKDETPTWLDKVTAVFNDLLRRLGINVKLTNADIKYLLWKSEQTLAEGNVADRRLDSKIQEKLAKERDIEIRKKTGEILSKVKGQKQAGKTYNIDTESGNTNTLEDEESPFDNIVDTDENYYRLSRRRREEISNTLKNQRPDLTEEQREALLDYFDTIDNQKVVDAGLQWFIRGEIEIVGDVEGVEDPSEIGDMLRVRKAVKSAEKHNLDLIKGIKKGKPDYKSPVIFLEKYPYTKSKNKKEKPIDPDTVPTLTNKRDVGHGITVYDVEDSKESMRNMREIINTHFGRAANPWCLLEGDGKGNLENGSSYAWKHYDAYPKRVAFYKGKLTAFCANSKSGVLWWSRLDHSSSEIPVMMSIKNDKLHRSADFRYDENKHRWITKPDRIFKKENDESIEWYHVNGPKKFHYRYKKDEHGRKREHGLQEEWYENGRRKKRYVMDMDKHAPNSINEEWYENGQKKLEQSFDENGNRNGTSIEWFKDGNIKSETHYKNGKQDGLQTTYYENEQVRSKTNYVDGLEEGTKEVYYENGKPKYIYNYAHGLFVGENKEFYDNGQEKIIYHYNNKGVLNGKVEEFDRDGNKIGEKDYKNGLVEGWSKKYYPNQQIEKRSLFNQGHYTGITESYYENGDTKSIMHNNVFYEEYYPGNILKRRIDFDKEGKKTRERTFYENKQPKSELKYYNEHLIEKREWFEDGNVKSHNYIKNGYLICEKYHQSTGKIASLDIYKDRELVQSEIFDENGNPTDSNLLASHGDEYYFRENREEEPSNNSENEKPKTTNGSIWNRIQNAFGHRSEKNEKTQTQQEQQTPTGNGFNINKSRNFMLISGAAKGADTLWEAFSKIYGNKKRLHTTSTFSDKSITTQERRKEANDLYKQVLDTLKRKELKGSRRDYILRDMLQAIDADAVFAIGQIQQQGEKIGDYVNESDRPVVAGGTGNAVQAAIQLGKPVHVFDINTGKWYIWDTNAKRTVKNLGLGRFTGEKEMTLNGNFVEENTPELTEKFAGIGSRDLGTKEQQAMVTKAIADVFEKSFGINTATSNINNVIGQIEKDREEAKKTKKEDKPNHDNVVATFGEETNTQKKEVESNTQQKNKLNVQLKDTSGYLYGDSKREGIKSDSTIDAIRSGERTAATRYGQNADVENWSKAKVGDRVEFSDGKGNGVIVEITKPLTKLTENTNAEQWSKKEGFSVKHFNDKVLTRIKGRGAWQIEFKYVEDAPKNNNLDIPLLEDIPTKEEAKNAETVATIGDNKEKRPKKTPVKKQNVAKNPFGYSGTTSLGVNIEDGEIDGKKIREERSKAGDVNTQESMSQNVTTPLAKLSQQGLTRKQIFDMSRFCSDTFSSIVLSKLAELKKKYENLCQEETADKTNLLVNRLILEKLRNPDLSHQETIKLIGINDILSEVRDRLKRYTDENHDKYVTDEDLIEQYMEDYGVQTEEEAKNLIQKHRELWRKFDDDEIFSIIMKQSVAAIEASENIKINLNEKNPEENSIEESSIDSEANEDFEDDDEFGENANGSEGWTFNAMKVDPHQSIRNAVRAVISQLPQVDGDGNFVMNSIGMPVKVNEQYVHAILINECAKEVRYADDFSYIDENGVTRLPIFEKLSVKYPFLNSLVTQLQNDRRLVSIFYTDFRKNKLDHIIINEKGNAVLINQIASSTSAIKSARSAYELGLVTSDSIWNNDSSPNDERIKQMSNLALEVSQMFRKYIDRPEKWTEERIHEVAEKAVKVFASIGFNVNEADIVQMFEEDSTKEDLRIALNNAKTIIDSFGDIKNIGKHLFDINVDGFNEIGKRIGKISENYIQLSVNQGGKQLQSYVAPNYIGNMIKRLNDPITQRRKEYIEKEFGKDDFFFDVDEDGRVTWKNEWLRLLMSEDEDETLGLGDIAICEVSMIGKQKLTTVNDIEVSLNTLAMYFSQGEESKSTWHQVPIYADSPSSNFIKFKRYCDTVNDSGETITFEDQLKVPLRNLVLQELKRIRKVQRMKASGVSMFQNYGKRGTKFCFMPRLNTLTLDDIYHNGDKTKFLNAIVNTASEINGESYQNTMDLIDDAVKFVMDEGYNEFRESLKDENPKIDKETNTILPSDTEIEVYNIINRKGNTKFEKERIDENGTHTITTYGAKDVERSLKEYYWNSCFATAEIIQLTTTDLAYYKDATDFQKRFKEVHAFGTRLNTNSRYGRKEEHVIYLADDKMISSTFDGIKASFDIAIKQGRISKDDADLYLDMFTETCRTDAQAYRSPKSYRALLDMLGMWTDDMEETFQRFEEGIYDEKDLYTLWNVIKPFMYSTPNRPNGIGGYNRTSVQNKNSEALIMSTFSFLGTALSKSPQLKALSSFMDENGIDVAMFSSACKAGSQGIININTSLSKVGRAVSNGVFTIRIFDRDAENNNGEKGKLVNKEFTLDGHRNYDEIMNGYKDNDGNFHEGFNQKLINGEISQNEYNAIVKYFKPDADEVRGILNNCVLNKVGNNDVMEDHKLDDGSNISYNSTFVTTMDYEDYMIAQPTPEHIVDTFANIGTQFQNLIATNLPKILSNVKDANGNPMSKEDVVKEYQTLITENLLDSFKKLGSNFTDIHKLQKRLLKMIEGNPKYGPDLINALEIVEYDGKEVFNIPLGAPQMMFEISTLINSMFKNNITRQKTKGGYAYLMSDYGIADLKVAREVIRDENGKAVGSRIKYAECLLPAVTRRLFEPYMKDVIQNGKVVGEELDIDKVKKECPKLLEAIGYRSPTEGKWSMVPLKIVGFLPAQCGNIVVMPADIVTHAGSDFDIDKIFMMLYDTYENVDENGKKSLRIHRYKTKDKDENPLQAKDNSREARNNRLIEICRGILTSDGVDLEFNSPNSFSKIKSEASLQELIGDKKLQTDLLEIINNWIEKNRGKKETEKFLEENNATENGRIELLTGKILLNVKRKHTGFLNNFVTSNRTEINPLSPLTYPYFFKQTVVGKKLISIYAVNNASYAKMQGHGFRIKEDYKYKTKGDNGRLEENRRIFQIVVNGRIIDQMDKEYITFEDGTVESITKNIGEHVGASVDNAKEQVLGPAGQNEISGPIIMYMIRSGMTIEEVSALINHPVVKGILKMAEECKSLNKAKNMFLFQSEMNDIDARVTFIDKMYLNTEELINHAVSHMNNFADEENDNEKKLRRQQREKEIGAIFCRIIDLANDFNSFTSLTRADSVNGAVKNTISSVLNKIISLDMYHEKSKQPEFPFSGVDETIFNDYLTDENGNFLSEEKMRELLSKSPMRTLQAYHSFGIEAAAVLPRDYFLELSPYMVNLVRSIAREAGHLRDEEIDAVFSLATAFLASSTKLLGTEKNERGEITNTYAQKRNYYIYQFPEEFRNMLKSNDEDMAQIKQLGVIKRMGVRDGKILTYDGADITGLLLQMYMDDFASLLDMGEKGQELAQKLFMYCFYHDNFKYGSDRFSRLLSSIFLTRFPEYVNTLRGAQKNMQLAPGEEKGSITVSETSIWNLFEDQVYANLPFLAKKSFSTEGSIFKEAIENSTDGITPFPTWAVKNPNNSNNPYRWITVKNRFGGIESLYKLVRDNGDGKTVLYKEMAMNPSGIMAVDANQPSNNLMKEVAKLFVESEELKQKESKKKKTNGVQTKGKVADKKTIKRAKEISDGDYSAVDKLEKANTEELNRLESVGASTITVSEDEINGNEEQYGIAAKLPDVDERQINGDDYEEATIVQNAVEEKFGDTYIDESRIPSDDTSAFDGLDIPDSNEINKKDYNPDEGLIDNKQDPRCPK